MAPSTRLQGAKARLRRLPVLGPILVTAYRLIKLPGRVALIVMQLNKLDEIQTGLSKLETKTDSLAWKWRGLDEVESSLLKLAVKTESLAGKWQRLEDFEGSLSMLAAKSDSLAAQLSALQTVDENTARAVDATLRATQESTAHVLAGISETTDLARGVTPVLVALHEKTDRYQAALHAQIMAIKPVIHAGENLVISCIDDFIMAFPAEEWRLPAFEIMAGHLEPGLLALVKSTVREGMAVVDVGANVGTYTLAALRAIGARGKVISYEPTPRVFDILKNNVQVNGFLESGRVDLRCKAVTDSASQGRPFHVLRNSLTHNSLFDDTSAAGATEVIAVETVSLDEDLAHLERLDVVKIDAEGAEPLILRGMRRLIERSPGLRLFIEFAPAHLKRANVDVYAFLEEIRTMGFGIQEVVEPTGELRHTPDEDLCQRVSVNLMLAQGTAK